MKDRAILAVIFAFFLIFVFLSSCFEEVSSGAGILKEINKKVRKTEGWRVKSFFLSKSASEKMVFVLADVYFLSEQGHYDRMLLSLLDWADFFAIDGLVSGSRKGITEDDCKKSNLLNLVDGFNCPVLGLEKYKEKKEAADIYKKVYGNQFGKKEIKRLSDLSRERVEIAVKIMSRKRTWINGKNCILVCGINSATEITKGLRRKGISYVLFTSIPLEKVFQRTEKLKDMLRTIAEMSD